MRSCLTALLLGLSLSSDSAADEPYVPCDWPPLFPPRAVLMQVGDVASVEVRRAREMRSREIRRVDVEITFTLAEIRAWQRRLNDLDSVTRFSYSYAFSMDQEAAKLALLRAEIKLDELRLARSDLIRRRPQGNIGELPPPNQEPWTKSFLPLR